MKTTYKWETNGRTLWACKIEFCCSDLSKDFLLPSPLFNHKVLKYCPFCGNEMEMEEIT